MIPELREKFNSNFTEKTYVEFLKDVWSVTGGKVDFRINETPLFLDKKVTSLLNTASQKIIEEIQTPEFLEHSKHSIPHQLVVPNEKSHPIFFQIDFALVNADGEIVPRLIELQGFPSLYSFQAFLDQKIRNHFGIADELTPYFSELTYDSYSELLKKVLIGDNDPMNTILLEIKPQKQKTKIDFLITQMNTGIDPVCVTKVYQRGKQLFRKVDGKEIRIERIYNRVIFDELLTQNLELKFNFHNELDVEWIGHPNWFFKLSKHTLPFLKNEYSPESYLLSLLEKYPNDLENFVLKPLYSFAGSGVKIDVTSELLDSITDKQNYILQKKVSYAPIIKTPDEYAKAEVRLMFIWDDKPVMVNNLLRTSKGKMMGVDFNKNKTWIGASIAYH